MYIYDVPSIESLRDCPECQSTNAWEDADGILHCNCQDEVLVGVPADLDYVERQLAEF